MESLYAHNLRTIDVCSIYPQICFNHSNVERIDMPQLANNIMEYHTLHGFSNDIIDRFHKIRINPMFKKGYHQICPSECSTKKFTPKIYKKTVNVNSLSVTQKEGNATIVKKIIHDMRANSNPTHKNPIVISNDRKIVDGHHRWMALKFMNLKSAHAYVIDMPHQQSMILAWILSKETHSF